ncbi:MAG: MATE family efflux transporter [Clostridia bacterium]|nr:MATE family efflux transporter [Clostridia bacterium]
MEENQSNRYLGEAKISKLLLKFSIPCVLSLLISSLYNIVDQIFIGNSELGTIGIAATSIVFPLTIIAQAFAWCFGDGNAAYLSICQGNKNTEKAHKSVGSILVLTLVTSLILLAIFYPLMDNILFLFGASSNSIGMAREYFTIILAFFPIFMLMNMMNAVVRADGSPAFSMASMLSGAIINIALDPIFIFACKWGIAGAAWATVIGQVVSFIISFVYFFRTKTFRLTLKSFIPDFKLIGTCIKLGLSSFITQMSIVAISLVCNIMLSKYGALSVYGEDIPIAVIGIETKVFTIVINLVVGVILGGQPILGYNYGAKKYDRVRQTYKLVLITTLIIGIVATVLFEACPIAIMSIFGSGNGVDPVLYAEYGALTFRIFLCLVTFTCTIKMTSIFFQSLGKPIQAIVASLLRDIVCFIPLVCIIPAVAENNKAGTGITALLWAAPSADLIAMIVAVILTVLFFRSLKKKEQEEDKLADYSEAAIHPTQKGVIVTIARRHGSAGKQAGKLAAEKLGIPFYYKEMVALAAQESGLDKEFISDLNANSPAILKELYLSTDVVQQAVAAQDKIIRKIADEGSCVIVGRAADYVLRDYPDVVKVFIDAPKEYRMNKVMEVYGDTREEAEKNIKRADGARAAYYKSISGKNWGEREDYDLYLDSSDGPEACAEKICALVAERTIKAKA